MIALVVALLVVFAGVAGWWLLVKKSNGTTVSTAELPTTQSDTNTAASSDQDQTVATSSLAAQSQLITDLANVTPQFVDDKENDDNPVALPANLEKIKRDIESIMQEQSILDEQAGSDVSFTLNAVGKRYVLVNLFEGPEGEGSPYILDSETLQSNYIPGLFQFETEKTAVYVSATDICTYTLDQQSCIPLPGAKLSGNEDYGDDQGLAGYFIPQDETHTDSSFTIAVLQWPSSPPSDTDTSNEPQKVRDITLPLPQTQ
jgi:hypothetical protein